MREGPVELQFLGQSVQFSSVAQSCLTVCDPMDCSTPDFPVHQGITREPVKSLVKE